MNMNRTYLHVCSFYPHYTDMQTMTWIDAHAMDYQVFFYRTIDTQSQVLCTHIAQNIALCLEGSILPLGEKGFFWKGVNWQKIKD
jgi:hypothetical protein